MTGRCTGRDYRWGSWPGSVAASHKETRRCSPQRRVGEGDVNLDDLPDEIVQPLVRLGRALMTHALAHRDTSLAEHEDEVLAAWRIVAPALLEGVLQLGTTGLEKNARPLASHCPCCDQRLGVQSQRKRELQTRLGPVRMQRWWHHCWKCGHGWS